MMHRIIAAALVAAALPLAASADTCLTDVDLENGVLLSWPEAPTSHFVQKTATNYTITTLYQPSDGPAQEWTEEFIHPLATAQRISPDADWRFEYERDPSVLADIRALGT